MQIDEIRLRENLVSTLAVEWIEIAKKRTSSLTTWVSTLAVEWIEIADGIVYQGINECLHPRGGVD